MTVVCSIKDKRGEDYVYPMLLEHNSDVVLFTSRQTGTVISSGGSRQFGEHRTDWADPDFYPWRPFKGSIVLENEDTQPSREPDNNQN